MAQKKNNEMMVLDMEKLMTPMSILIAGLMISVSVLVAFRGTNLTTSSTKSTDTTTTDDTTVTQFDPSVGDGTTTVSIDDDPKLGSNDAKVAIVEFSDYECPFCKRHFEETSELIKEAYVDTGDVLWVYRDFPLDFHDPLASKEAQAAECIDDLAGDDKYFEYHDLIFTNTISNGQGLEESKLYDFATEVGVNRDEFASCFDSGKFADEVKNDIANGGEAGITGTPGFVIGKLDSDGNVTGIILAGAYPFSTFQEALDYQLANL
jgi:protein-disulfide isomerase